MKPSLPLTMEARIRQARRDVLRGHNHARRMNANPHSEYLKPFLVMLATLMCAALLAEYGRRFAYVPSALLVLLFKVTPFCLMITSITWLGRALKEEAMLRPVRRYQEALEFLTETYDLRAIGPLAEIYWLRHRPPVVAGALTRLLRVQAQMQVSAALHERQRRGLYRIVARPNIDEVDLQLAILEFLETFGDTRALPSVRVLAEGETRSLALKTAALRCQAALQAEQASAAGQQTLLRGTLAPALPSEDLLRPSLHTPETQPEQLLRATTQE